MNRYPLWKNIFILAVLSLCVIYATPNIYPSQPALQISSTRVTVTKNLVNEIKNDLEKSGINFYQVGHSEQGILVRFTDTKNQLAAAQRLREKYLGKYTVALNLASTTPHWLKALEATPMNLGLDLRGGVHFLMEVDTAAALDNAYERSVTDMRELLRQDKIRYSGIKHTSDAIKISARSEEIQEQIEEVIKDQYFDSMDITTSPTSAEYFVIAKLKPDALKEVRRLAIAQNTTTLRKRVNELGVAEPVIQQQGKDRVVVQLPGVQDTARAKEILGATATLEFRLVDEQGDPFEARETGRVPIGDKLYYERNKNPVLLKKRVMLTGDYIIDASSGIDNNARPAVTITLDGKGARIFSKVTGENVDRLMGVVFIETKSQTVYKGGKNKRITKKVEEVINVARIKEQLAKRFQITGLSSTVEARNLALLLRAGSLAAPMYIVEERTVGPSLGQQNIDLGTKSVIIGFLLVIIFMAIYYRVFGLVANIALGANLVMIVAIMSMIPGATLTLPGIAGIVLTVGMAVDANVLIFERIKEELQNNNSPQSSINLGYSKALSTIADANITTLIAALVLFVFGTGPIKGFAVTLSIGIICSMFTAIMGTRSLINIIYGRKRSPVLYI